MLRIVHTADWHLGHTLGDHDRSWEHGRLFAWLLETLAEEQADALLIAGDIFETANPSASATASWYGLLADIHQRLPDLEVVVIAGNHDSAGRLDAPQPLLDRMGVRVIGSLPRDGKRLIAADRTLVPLHDKTGQVAAWVAAVPFLRPADLPTLRELGAAAGPDDSAGGVSLIDGVRWVYGQVLAAAQRVRQPDQALIAMGHCYMVGTQLSELSERRILGGNLNALPVDLFSEAASYVALGHLHLAQTVGGRQNVRYAGSPLPLSVGERTYPHQVSVVDLDGADLHAVRSVRVPRFVDVLQVPATGPGPLAEVEALLSALPGAETPVEAWPWLHVDVALDELTPGVMTRVRAALEDRGVRLVDVRVHYAEGLGGLADGGEHRELASLSPEEVFRRRCARAGLEPVPEPLLVAFAELVEAAEAEDEADGPVAPQAATTDA